MNSEYIVEFIPGFELDLADICDWYEARKIGLSAKVVARTEKVLRLLASHPKIYEKVYKDYHRALIQGFPIGIFYKVLQNKVLVYSIFDLRQDSKKLTRKLL